MVKCKKCGREYDDGTIACFVTVGISVCGMRCRDCGSELHAGTYKSSIKEVSNGIRA